VHKGDLLAEIDTEPFQIAVSQKQAAVGTASADLQAATAGARGIEAEAMSRRWKLQRAVEDLNNQIALLRARVAALDKSKATLALAQVDFNRAKQLLGTPAESRQQYDQAQKTFSTADAQVNQALADIYGIGNLPTNVRLFAVWTVALQAVVCAGLSVNPLQSSASK